MYPLLLKKGTLFKEKVEKFCEEGERNMFEEKLGSKIAAIYFISLSALMHYFYSQIIPLFTTPVQQVFVVLAIATAFVSFLIEPDMARAAVAVKAALILSAPMFVMIMASLLLWSVEMTGIEYIIQGLWHYGIYVNQLLAALYAAAFLYMFGEKGIWYHLAGLLLVNFFLIGKVIFEYGPQTYFSEFATLLTSFAGETGDVMAEAEIHELVYCVGTYAFFMLLTFRKNVWFLAGLVLSMFCFLSALKRIGVLAMVVGLLAGWMLQLASRHIGPKTVSKVITSVLLMVAVVLLFYIFAVKMGFFDLLEDYGIDTMGRALIYKKVSRFYEFLPNYIGQGMGFLAYQLTVNLNVYSGSVHNDFLQFYIDLGFWGYIFWILTLTVLRTKYFGRGGKITNEIITFAVILFMLVISSTDNTLNHQMFYIATDMVIMGYGFHERVQEERQRGIV